MQLSKYSITWFECKERIIEVEENIFTIKYKE